MQPLRYPEGKTMTVIRRFLLAVAALAASFPAASAGADPHPQPPIIHLHYDYMVDADGFSYAPSDEAVRIVVESFRDRGIVLHVDPHHAAIPARRVLVLEGRSPGYPDPMEQYAGTDFAYLADLKAQYFDPPQPNRAYHYVIFGHYDSCASPAQCAARSAATRGTYRFRALGIAFIGGYDFIVSLGAFRDLGRVPSDIQVAGILMHELGHNLGLRHGGSDGLDLKPNYISVMNNNFITRGIGTAAGVGGIEPVSVRIDYSDRALPALDETAVDESVGLQSGTNDISFTNCFLGLTPIPGTGPVDFNCDGDSTDAFGMELNLSPLGGGLVGEDYLEGHDDWSFVHAVLQTPAYFRAQRPLGEVSH